MQRTTCDGESEQQAAGRIFAVGIILNEAGLAPACRTSPSLIFRSMARLKAWRAEFEFTSSELSANVTQRFHGVGCRGYSGSLRSVQHDRGRTGLCERGWRLMISCPRATRERRRVAWSSSCSRNAHDERDGRTPTLALCSRNARPQKSLVRRPHVDQHGCLP